MDILVIGGSAFLGRAVAEEALRRGHQVTTFNRGRSHPDVPGVEAVRGDRESPGDLRRLAEGRSWDFVVDTSGHVPRVVGESARALSGRAASYVFVSTVSALRDFPAAPIRDDTGLLDCPPGAGPGDGDYGTLKAGCERAVVQAFGDAALIIRPGLMLGPHEDVARLPWWLTRISHGGRVLAPGDPGVRMQLIDARDVAAFTLDRAEQGAGGDFNVTGPAAGTTYGEWLELCRQVTGSDAEFVWVDDGFLLEQGVTVFTELPLWGGPPSPQMVNFWNVPTGKAEAAGLRTRPVAETVRDTWEWLRRIPEDERTYGSAIPHGLDPAKERAILAAWDARSR